MAGDDVVLSDVHLGTQPGAAAGCTRFHFTAHQQQQDDDSSSGSPSSSAGGASQQPELDSDGDAVVCRPSHTRHAWLIIHHALATPISRCGEQVWTGSCLLADWVVAAGQQELQGQVVVELGAGVGLASLVAARFVGATGSVLLTDGGEGALAMASRNAAVNTNCRNVRVRRLDWCALFDTQLARIADQHELLQLLNSSCVSEQQEQQQPVLQQPEQAAGGQQQQQPVQQRAASRQQQPVQQQVASRQQQPGQQEQAGSQQWLWQPDDLDVLARTHVWFASDVIYDEALTEAFLHTAAQLMRWQQQQSRRREGSGSQGALPKLVVVCEKRVCFTLRDMDAVAHAFDHFLSYVQRVESGSAGVQCQAHQQAPVPQGKQQQPLFLGRRLDVSTIPQALEYDRPRDCLELWELTLPPDAAT